MKKIIVSIFIIILITTSGYVYKNFHLLIAKYAEYKFNKTKNDKLIKNKVIVKNMSEGVYQFENDTLNYKEFSLKKLGIELSQDIDEKPIGYFDIYQDKIFLVMFDGSFYLSNSLSEIKNDNFKFNKIADPNENIKLHPNDDLNYRNIKIRDILIHQDNLFIVSNDSKVDKEKNDYTASIKVFKGKISEYKKNIEMTTFFSTDERYLGLKYEIDWSHTGGRIVHYENEDYLLSVSDFHLKPYEFLIDKISSDRSIVGKTLLINEDEVKLFSKGHRNIQGLFYDKKNRLIFSSEHGPVGGDEINLIQNGKDYGWPRSSYGTLGYDFSNHPRKHKKYGFKEPLYYWWPYNCAPSEITIVSENFVKNWKESLLVSCLSGNHLNGTSFIRFVYNKNSNKLERKEQHYIDDRIRDFKYLDKEKILIMLLEGKKSFAFIYK